MKLTFPLLILLLAATAQAGKFSFIDFTKIKNFFGSRPQGKIVDTRKIGMENGKPDFCAKYECPPFVALKSTKHYQLRCYDAVNWVSTTGYGSFSPMWGVQSQMFRRLFKYIQGANADDAVINMTVPVMTEIKGSGSKKNLKMSFYLPESFQKAPPAPTNDKVFFEKKKFCAYVHSFGGYVLFSRQYENHMKMLKKALAKDGLQDSYVVGTVNVAGYNGPTTIRNRHNEVMLIKK